MAHGHLVLLSRDVNWIATISERWVSVWFTLTIWTLQEWPSKLVKGFVQHSKESSCTWFGKSCHYLQVHGGNLPFGKCTILLGIIIVFGETNFQGFHGFSLSMSWYPHKRVTYTMCKYVMNQIDLSHPPTLTTLNLNIV